jgi:hypothetical protein
MNAYVPGDFVRDASARLVHSALPDAPVRRWVAPPPIAAACRRVLAAAVCSLAAAVRPQSDEDEDAYDAWSGASELCADALTAWRTADAPRRSEAHALYCAALDREEAAARELARVRGSARTGWAIRR